MKVIKTEVPPVLTEVPPSDFSDYEYANEYPVLSPFGPPIYIDTVSEKAVDELDKLIEELGGNIEFDASGRLAGRIKKQTELTNQISDELFNEILMHNDRYAHYAVGGSGKRLTLSGLWSNIQEAREYNPPHAHTGSYSFVIYCRNDLEKYAVEDLHDNEYDAPHAAGANATHEMQNRKLAGLIELQYGEPNTMNFNTYTFIPKRRDIIIFPSWLRHTVYAHYKEGDVRISVAGNVDIVPE